MTQSVFMQNPTALTAVPPSPDGGQSHSAPRNSGRALDMDWVDEIRVNLSAAERRGALRPAARRGASQEHDAVGGASGP